MKCPHMVDAGAYVLGALAPTDRAAYERHLSDCPCCREEVAELAVLPGLLGRLDAGTAASLDVPSQPAPPRLLTATLAAARAERSRAVRRRRWERAGAAVAATVLAAAVGLGVAFVDGGSGSVASPPVVAQMTPVNATIPVNAFMGYAAAPGGGTDIQMLCLYRSAASYGGAWTVQLVVYPKSGGHPQVLRSWQVSPGQDVAVHRHTSLAPDQIAKIALTNATASATGTPLLIYQPT